MFVRGCTTVCSSKTVVFTSPANTRCKTVSQKETLSNSAIPKGGHTLQKSIYPSFEMLAGIVPYSSIFGCVSTALFGRGWDKKYLIKTVMQKEAGQTQDLVFYLSHPESFGFLA